VGGPSTFVGGPSAFVGGPSVYCFSKAFLVIPSQWY